MQIQENAQLQQYEAFEARQNYLLRQAINPGSW
jgi:hypothetical protein